MRKSYRFFSIVLLLGSYLLGACSGGTPQENDSQSASGSKSTEVVFTGTVESMGGAQWLINAQQVGVDVSTSIDQSIQIGDVVKVEAVVQADGSVVASKIESTSFDNSNANSNAGDEDDPGTNDNTTNANDSSTSGEENSNDNSNVNSNDNSNDDDNEDHEIYGVVEAVTEDSITIDGVTYSIANFTEFNDAISAGDLVKVHVIVSDDGMLVISEIEKVTGIGDDNGNVNGDDSGNSNSNSNDDDDNGSSNNNSNHDDDNDDDNGNDNSNDSNSNDD